MKKELLKLREAYLKDDEEKQEEILENLEDNYHVDLTTLYGEDFSDKKILEKLEKKIK